MEGNVKVRGKITFEFETTLGAFLNGGVTDEEWMQGIESIIRENMFSWVMQRNTQVLSDEVSDLRIERSKG